MAFGFAQIAVVANVPPLPSFKWLIKLRSWTEPWHGCLRLTASTLSGTSYLTGSGPDFAGLRILLWSFQLLGFSISVPRSKFTFFSPFCHQPPLWPSSFLSMISSSAQSVVHPSLCTSTHLPHPVVFLSRCLHICPFLSFSATSSWIGSYFPSPTPTKWGDRTRRFPKSLSTLMLCDPLGMETTSDICYIL